MSWDPARPGPARAVAALCVAALLAIVPAHPAGATDDIGLFFDTQGQQPCLQAGSFTTVATYLILLDPSCRGGVCAWECAVRCENGNFLGSSLSGQVINFATPPQFYVAVSPPLPTGSLILLAQLNYLAAGSGPTRFYIERCTTGIEEAPMYADCADTEHLLVMTPRTFSPGGAVAGVNLPECTPESATWGQVKSVFR